MKIYSIEEIVSATNNLLESKSKKEIKDYTSLPTEKIPLHTEKIIIEAEKTLDAEKIQKQIIEEPLILDNQVSSINTPRQFNYKIKIKPEVKNDIIDELYGFLKKKVKKNTLKLIIDEQIEIKNLQNKIKFLKKNEDKIIIDYELLNNKYNLICENYRILNIDNDNLRNTLEQVTIHNDQLDKDNKEFKINLKDNNVKLVNATKINRSLEINNHELKNTVSRYITNYKKLVEEIKQLKNSDNQGLKDENLKVKFYQNENIRLSSELFSAQKINANIKENLNDIKFEKEKISNKIFELNKAIGAEKTNIIPSSFTQEVNTIREKKTSVEKNDLVESKKDISKNLTSSEQESLDEVINRIFAKI